MHKSFLNDIENYLESLPSFPEGSNVNELIRTGTQAGVITRINSEGVEYVISYFTLESLIHLRNREETKVLKSNTQPIYKVTLATPPIEVIDIFKKTAALWIAVYDEDAEDVDQETMPPVGYISEKRMMDALHQAYLDDQETIKQLNRKIIQKDEYVAILAHDVRSPLTVISICCDYISHLTQEEKTGGGEDVDLKDFVARIKGNAMRANSLVQNILNLSAISQSGQRTIDFVPSLISEILRNIKENLSYISSSKNIEVTIDSGDDIYALVAPYCFSQIIENLVNNAIKFSPEDTNIRLSAKIVKNPDSPEKEDNWLEVQVIDEGPGIPEEKIEAIFKSYEQVGDQSNNTKGVGLGLSIAQQFTKLHHGKIEVDSVIGKGATFKVYVPNASLKPIEISHVPEKRPTQGNLLVVDDDPDILEYIEAILTEEGYQVSTAIDGLDALKVFASNTFDLVVTDMKMPNMDGIELMQAIKAEVADIPIILATGYYPTLDNDAARDIFASEQMLKKPFSKEQLVKSVRQGLDRKTLLKKAS